jgi:phage terminase large subunit
MSRYQINWPPWAKVVNERFIPLIGNKDRYLLLWGGRGSSKSVFAAKKLIFRCLTEKYFRFILIRKQYNSIKDSQYQTLKDIIYELNLQELFEFKISPLEITCINGNKFLARGCDDTTKLKSIKDPTGAWYEEDIIEEKDFITITTSIRTSKADYLQEIFTFNPEVEGDYQQNWFWKRFFEGKNDVNFSSTATIEIGPDKQIELSYTSHHSTYKDNRWIPNEFIAFLRSMKETNPYYYTIYCLGRWGNKTTSGQFYKLFEYAKNGLDKPVYNHGEPLHISFDFNVNPYITCTVWQITGKRGIQIDEICLSTPSNTTKAACREFIRKYQGHVAGLFIYGDPAGMHEDTRSEKGFNDYVIIREELKQFRPTLRLTRQAPPVVMRGNFINTIFATGYDGVELFIGYNCTHSINDYLYCKEASDGTKAKEKVKNNETDVTYEKYGHTSDANDYLITTVFASEFSRYQKGGADMKVTTGKNYSKHGY